MPGGIWQLRYPARMAMGILSENISKPNYQRYCTIFEKDELTIILKQIRRDSIHLLPQAREGLLDAVSALLGVCH